MSTKKKTGSKLTNKEKKQAQLAAYRRARMQWYIVGVVLALIVIAVIVLFVIFTDGEVPVRTNPNG